MGRPAVGGPPGLVAGADGAVGAAALGAAGGAGADGLAVGGTAAFAVAGGAAFAVGGGAAFAGAGAAAFGGAGATLGALSFWTAFAAASSSTDPRFDFTSTPSSLSAATIRSAAMPLCLATW